jgi:hypothetical protein
LTHKFDLSEPEVTNNESRISKIFKQNIMRDVKSLDLSYEKLNSSIDHKYRLNKKENLQKFTNNLITKDEKIKKF